MTENLQPPSDRARIFKRGASITIAEPFAGSYTGQEPNGIIVADLRTAFTVEKSIGKGPNTAEVTLTNLSERTRALVQKKPLYVRIDAGYDGQLERLFTGNLRYATSEHEGADWNTRLELGDGERAFKYARVNRSFERGVSALQALTEAARTMGLVPKLSSRARTALGAQFAAGLSLSGTAADEITRLVSPFGLSWSIQDGKLQVLFADETDATEAIVISEDSGMVGSPAYGDPAKKGGKPILHVTTALKSAIRPGGRIRVDARSVKGTFRVERVRHRGDTHGSEWFSEIEAKAA